MHCCEEAMEWVQVSVDDHVLKEAIDTEDFAIVEN